MWSIRGGVNVTLLCKELLFIVPTFDVFLKTYGEPACGSVPAMSILPSPSRSPNANSAGLAEVGPEKVWAAASDAAEIKIA